ncbi:hypothetical protein NIES2100_78220 [Calothrix sp. NIES-2100]|uniref:hypothetical protein n=1 Tax=Calothrix sp. NIES-2100 TaxID=1954172 RepID=UPI000B5DBAC4|nr:hypothetical protein NIES2100_78220 [Calothrix sp. NIES-2100]
MTYKQRGSRVLEKAVLRCTQLEAIDPNMNFEDTCNLQYLRQLIEKLRSQLDSYNNALKLLDSIRTEIETMEKSLSELSGRLLLGVACKYGNNSVEYMMAGGVRKSDRIRKSIATRRKKAAAKVKSSEVGQPK